jgi:DNA processing protein
MIGAPRVLEQAAIAIIGSRKASPYGLLCAQRFARRAAIRGLVVVSGGAVGCDQAAHTGAIETEMPTIVVLGCGADVEYPANSRTIFQQILEAGGLLLSELPWKTPPARWAFVRRNRIIAGLAGATLIIEAGMPSGTFSTADVTLSLGRELLVVPGSILSKQSAGCNHLIAQGAWPIIDDSSFDSALTEIYRVLPLMDMMQQMDNSADETRESKTDQETDPVEEIKDNQDRNVDVLIMERLKSVPSRPDDLVDLCGKDIVEVIRYLSVLEFTGQIARQPDGRFTAITRR